MEKLIFTVALKVCGAIIAEIEGVAEIHFDHTGEPEIWTIDLDGRRDGRDNAVRIASNDPLYPSIKAAISQQCEAEIYELADKIERGRKSYAQEMARGE